MNIPYKWRAAVTAVVLAGIVLGAIGQTAAREIRHRWDQHNVASVQAAPPIPVTVPSHTRPAVRPPFALILPDCEKEGRSLPCVTFDESHWRIVWEYGRDTYTYQDTRKCHNRSGTGGPLPCVWTIGHENFRVYARTVDIG